MKFTCSQLALTKALNTVSKAVSVRTTIPILKGILLNVKDGVLTLTASDLDLGIETRIDVQASEDGTLVASAKLLGDIVRKLPNALINIEDDKDGKLSISCLGSSFSIIALPADEYPSIGLIKEVSSITLDKECLKELIKKTTFAASIDEKKGILVGCLMAFSQGSLEMVALDGFRMAVATEAADINETKSIIVPARILNEVSKILSESVDQKDIKLTLDEKKAEIVTEDTRIVARLLEGEFIKYNDIIPKTSKVKCIISREEMMSSIERASLLAKEGKNNLIKVTISQGNMEITSRSEEGNVVEKLQAEVEGDDIVIGFNSKYVLDVLKAVSDEEILMEMTSSTSSCLIKPTEGNEYTYLVLPVRISAS